MTNTDKTKFSVASNVEALTSYNRSMAVALEKAENGSEAETMYFLEKLERTADLLGYRLTPTEPD